jgi:hypothetical protein
MNPGAKAKVKIEYLQPDAVQPVSGGDESTESASAESGGTTTK